MISDILQHLDDPTLDVSSVAARRGLSPRYVHQLLQGTGRTFSELVLQHRLDRVYQSLRDPACDAENISALAFAAGFADLSYFNRRFRRRYGLTPSALRRERP